jgi:hypothetical protein
MPRTAAAKAEALGENVEFDFDGETYTVAPAAEWDLDVMESYEDGKIASTIRALLGPAQWATFRSKPRKVADLNSLFEAVQVALGISGN